MIYLDTSALRGAGLLLAAPWFTELRELAKDYSLSLVVTDLVVSEWTRLLHKEMRDRIRRIEGDRNFLDQFGIALPERTRVPDVAEVRAKALLLLESAGVTVIPDAELDIKQLVGEALDHKAPFEKDDKGFRDTLIIETFAQDSEKQDHRAVVIVEDDAFFQSTERFKRRGVEVEFIRPKDVPEWIQQYEAGFVEYLDQVMHDKLWSVLQEKGPEILEFVGSANLTFSGSSLLDEPGQPTILSVHSATPKRLLDCSLGVQLPGFSVNEDRYPITIDVELTLDVTVRTWGSLTWLFGPSASGIPAEISPAEPIDLSTPPDREPPPSSRRQELMRTVTVFASIDRVAFERGDIEGLQLHRAI